MKKLIRSSYPVEINVIILLSLYFFAVVFSYEMFDVRFHNPEHLENSYPGMALFGVAVVLAIMIVWEELLFHVKIKEINGGLIFRSHRKKFRIQLMLFAGIPLIFYFIYLEYDLKVSHFLIWAFFCIVLPAGEVIMSGINNQRYFLKLTTRMIKFKNGDHEGTYPTKEIRNIRITTEKTRRFVNIKKLELLFANSEAVEIDLDEMNLHVFYESILVFIKKYYGPMLIEESVATVQKPTSVLR